MIGKYNIKIIANNIEYDITIKRNITIINDYSASGKSTLVKLINDYLDDIGYVEVIANVKIDILNDQNWKNKILIEENCIFFIDEDSKFVTKNEFAVEINKGNNNYFVIINRNNLSQLNYSVDEIYKLEFKNNKYKLYSNLKFEDDCYNTSKLNEIIITEDERSSYIYMKYVYKNLNIDKSSGRHRMLGKINKLIKSNNNVKFSLIVDCASFGSNIIDIIDLLSINEICYKINKFESFEYILCLIQDIIDIEDIIKFPENFIDSKKFNSYGVYFENLITHILDRINLKYTKSEINDYFKKDYIIDRFKTIINIDYKENEYILNWD